MSYSKATHRWVLSPIMSHQTPSIRPSLSKTQALELLKSHFGLVGDISTLPGHRNQNFHLISSCGDQFVLKIAGPEEPKDILDLQTDALAFLAKREIGISFPETVDTIAGDYGFKIYDEQGSQNWVQLFTYIEGEILGTVQDRNLDLLESFGKAMVRLDTALAELKRPTTANQNFQWDLTLAHEVISTNISHIQSQKKRSYIESVLLEFDTVVTPLLSELPTSIIHNDANDYNVVVSPLGPEGRKIIGILDFGDIIECATVCDLAIGASYALMGTPDPMAAIASVVRGYHHTRALTETEVEVIFSLVKARLGVSVSISASIDSKHSKDPYLTIHEEAAWDALYDLATVNTYLARDLLRNTCDYG